MFVLSPVDRTCTSKGLNGLSGVIIISSAAIHIIEAAECAANGIKKLFFLKRSLNNSIIT